MFIEKLNKKQEGVYVIEEEKTVVDDIYEGYLNHDNVNHQTIYIYTGSKLTGERVENYFISTPSETPWKTHLKVFSNSKKVYITYETTGDQVEADDINLLQDSIVDEINRSRLEEKNLDNKINKEVQRSITKDNNTDEKLDNEINRSTVVDTTMDNKIDNEVNRSINKDDSLNSKINDEVERSRKIENTLNIELMQETVRAKEKENILQSNIDLESHRSKQVEQDLNTDIDNERTRAIEKETNIENAINSYIDSNNLEINRLDKADGELESNKADKVYVDKELNKKYSKEQVFTKEEVLQKIQDIIGTAPEALDTLEELARALDNDPNFATNIINLLGTKVDKTKGKELSTNDFTDLLKTKLSGIESGANKYIHPDTHLASIIIESATRRFVSDTEKANWNSKETPSGAKDKADTAESNAKEYTDIHDKNTTKHIISTERVNWNDADSKKHIHSNKSILDKVTQVLVDSWNSAVEHVKDSVRHITSAERTKWNKVGSKSDKSYVDNELEKKFNKTGGDISGNVKADTWVAGQEFLIGYNGTSDDRNRFKIKYNSSSGSLELWRFTNAHVWELGTTFPNRNGVGGLIVEGKTMASIVDLPTRLGQLQNDKKYVTQSELGNAGYGDMTKSIYDKNNNGIVDNAEKVNGFTVQKDVPSNAVFTDTKYTKSSIGLSNVDNVKQLPISGGILTGNLTINTGGALRTIFSGDSWNFVNQMSSSGGWARSLLGVKDENLKTQMQIGVHGSAQTFSRMYFGEAWDNWTMEIRPSTKEVSFNGEILKQGKKVATITDIPTKKNELSGSLTWNDLKGV